MTMKQGMDTGSENRETGLAIGKRKATILRCGRLSRGNRKSVTVLKLI